LIIVSLLDSSRDGILMDCLTPIHVIITTNSEMSKVLTHYMLIHAGIIFLNVYDAYSDRLGTEIIYLLHVHLHQDDICLHGKIRHGDAS
jgi:hypothetical protein